MRKFIGICVAAAILVSMLAFTPLASVAAEPTKLIDFYWEELYYEYGPAGENECIVNWKDNALYFTANTEGSELGDPYFTVSNSSGFEADENPWMVIKLKNLSDIGTFEMHYATSLHTMGGATVLHFDITAQDTDYKTYVVNIPQANLDTAYPLNGPDGIAQQAGSTDTPIEELTDSTWEGTVSDIRLDCLYKEGKSGMVPDGAEMYIEYLAFFATEEDANAYAATGPDRSNYVAPPTAAPVEGEDALPNYDAVIFFNEESYWEDYINIEGTPANGMYFDGLNEDGDAALFIIEKGNDPYLQMLPYEPVDAEEWPVMQMKIRKNGSVNSGQIYYTTYSSPNMTESQTASIKYQATEDWQIVNINLNEKNNGFCVGDYHILRIDPFTSSPEESTYEIAYIAFFKSIAAAEQYTANGGDFSELESMTPEPDPETPTPSAATQKPTPTKSAAAASPSSPANEESGNSGTVLIIVIAAVIVVAGIVTAVIIVKKKKKSGTES